MTAKVLVVDDLLANVKLLEAKLTNEYYNVLTASNGFEALKIIQENALDLVLLDVMMPDMNGFEVCKKIKSDPKTAQLPVVMVTALSDIKDKVIGLQAGADDFLTKPINEIALMARVKSLIRLKYITDELELRNQTGLELGFSDNNNIITQAKIILIDDDIIQSQKIAHTLIYQGHRVKIVSNLNEAIAAISRDEPDLIITNFQVDGADGLRLISQVRGLENMRHTPILVMIEENDNQILVKSLEIGASDYIILPPDENELIARVNTQIKRKTYQNKLKDNYKKSISMAMTDGLTGLYNRRYMETHLQKSMIQAKAQNKKLSIMFMDIDFFKKVNDTYGHVAGDEILQELAKRLEESVRITDLVARYGGEEFVIIFSETNLVEAQKLGERVRINVEKEKFKVSAEIRELAVTISAGITLMEEDDNIESFLKRADSALYKSKESGRNIITVI